MKSPEQILENYTPNKEYPNYYHENNVIDAMKEYLEENSNNTQQLKAEITAIADSVEDYTTTGADAGTIACIVRDLRQLSAV